MAFAIHLNEIDARDVCRRGLAVEQVAGFHLVDDVHLGDAIFRGQSADGLFEGDALLLQLFVFATKTVPSRPGTAARACRQRPPRI